MLHIICIAGPDNPFPKFEAIKTKNFILKFFF